MLNSLRIPIIVQAVYWILGIVLTLAMPLIKSGPTQVGPSMDASIPITAMIWPLFLLYGIFVFAVSLFGVVASIRVLLRVYDSSAKKMKKSDRKLLTYALLCFVSSSAWIIYAYVAFRASCSTVC